MVAYNFQERFEGPIRSGRKTHTIRRDGKRRHARPGERLQLYVGQRSPACKKILDADAVCEGVYPVVIRVGAEALGCVTVGGACVKSIGQFAKSDGFKNAADMHAFWLRFHGVGTFVGSMIEWRAAP